MTRMTRKRINDRVRVELLKNVDAKTLSTGQNFFKEHIKLYGVRISLVTKISRDLFDEIKDLPKSDVFNYCEQLFESGYLEESFVACKWCYFLLEKYQPEDFEILERWLTQYVNNWATCDTLCNHPIGAFLELYPQYLSKLSDWAGSENRWVRRGAAVSLIMPARKGKYLNVILDIASKLIADPDDLVQKGYGWMLKSASECHQKEIFDFVIEHKNQMPRTALRYSIEKMPKEMKAMAMKKE